MKKNMFSQIIFFMICVIKAAPLILGITISTRTAGQQQVIQLYKGAAPGSENWNWEEKETSNTPIKFKIAYNVTHPTLTVYRPDTSNGTAIIIFPGGGMRVVNIENEGSKVAQELNKKGITVFVLKYRVVRSMTANPWQEMMENMKDTVRFRADNAAIRNMVREDATNAMLYVRKHAADFKIDSNRVGVLGFSAGGGLAIYLTLNGPTVTRPNFAGFIYATFRPDGNNALPANAPPVFIACATDDILASSTNSVNLYNAWIAANNSAELHIYAKGGHGLRGSREASTWITRFQEWLGAQGY
jgi:acetyl esterase/lipase